MELDIRDRTAIVTGAANGIGRVIAMRLASEGVNVALWDRNEEALSATAGELTAAGASVVAAVCDVQEQGQVNRALRTTLDRFGTVDILVANAGIAPASQVTELDPEQWDEVFGVNTRGVFLCAKAVAPVMKERKKGRIIIASSFAAIIPSVGYAAYAASKGALVSLTRVLAAELGPWGITVNAYAPGMIPSAMSGIDGLSATRQEEMLDTLCLREWGRAEDIASLVVFLASDQARYITGTHIDASGGKFAVQFAKLARK